MGQERRGDWRRWSTRAPTFHRYVDSDDTCKNADITDEIIRNHPSLSYLSKLLPENAPDPLPSDLSTSPHLTIFAPSNDALKGAFDDVETRYLESDYGVEAIGRIMAGGVVLGVGKKEKVGWRDTWGNTGLGGERFVQRSMLGANVCHR